MTTKCILRFTRGQSQTFKFGRPCINEKLEVRPKLVERATPEPFQSYRIFEIPFVKKFRGEMQMSSREGSEQNYENNNVSLTIQNKTNFKTL